MAQLYDMKKNKLLTVCIPTYKRHATLRRCIKSVADQIEKYHLHNDVGIYVANDASPDNTLDVLGEFEAPSFFTSVTRKNNLGMNVNIKTMLLEIKNESDYQLIITDDDYLQPDKLEEIVEFLKEFENDNEKVSAIWTPRYSYTEDGKINSVECKPFNKTTLVKPTSGNVGRYMANGYILSGLIIKADCIDYNFWEEYDENAYFPIVFFGDLLLKNGALYWNNNIVHHTVLNKCHWESWGESELVIELRKFSDYINVYQIMEQKNINAMIRLPYYFTIFASIYNLVGSVLSSRNLAGNDESVIVGAAKELKAKGYLKFKFYLVTHIIGALITSAIVSIMKIGVTKLQLLFSRNNSQIDKQYRERVGFNLERLQNAAIFYKVVF